MKRNMLFAIGPFLLALGLPTGMNAQGILGARSCSMGARKLSALTNSINNPIAELGEAWQVITRIPTEATEYRNYLSDQVSEYGFLFSPIELEREHSQNFNLSVFCGISESIGVEVRLFRFGAHGDLSGITHAGSPNKMQWIRFLWESNVTNIFNNDVCSDGNGGYVEDFFCGSSIPYWIGDDIRIRFVDAVLRWRVLERENWALSIVLGAVRSVTNYSINFGENQFAVVRGVYQDPILPEHDFWYNFENDITLGMTSVGKTKSYGLVVGAYLERELFWNMRANFGARFAGLSNSRKDNVVFVDIDDVHDWLVDRNHTQTLLDDELVWERDSYINGGFNQPYESGEFKSVYLEESFDVTRDFERVTAAVGLEERCWFAPLGVVVKDIWGFGSNKAPVAMQPKKIPENAVCTRSFFAGASFRVF